MGLLSRISNMNKGKSKGGLLALAEQYGAQKPETVASFFAEWADNLGIKKCALFCADGDFFRIEKSLGLDLGSIARSVSTADFWTGLEIPEAKWKTFQNDDVIPLYQLFSENQNNFESAYILKSTHDGKPFYFLICSENGEKSSVLDEKSICTSLNQFFLPLARTENFPIDDGFEISSANLFIISAKLAIEKAFSNLDSKIREKLSQVAMEELFFKIKKIFRTPNCAVLGSNCEIKTVLFSKEEIDEKLLQFHINNCLKDFFESIGSEILVLTAGICPSKKGTQTFLQQD